MKFAKLAIGAKFMLDDEVCQKVSDQYYVSLHNSVLGEQQAGPITDQRMKMYKEASVAVKPKVVKNKVPKTKLASVKLKKAKGR